MYNLYISFKEIQWNVFKLRVVKIWCFWAFEGFLWDCGQMGYKIRYIDSALVRAHRLFLWLVNPIPTWSWLQSIGIALNYVINWIKWGSWLHYDVVMTSKVRLGFNAILRKPWHLQKTNKVVEKGFVANFFLLWDILIFLKTFFKRKFPKMTKRKTLIWEFREFPRLENFRHCR